MEGDTPCKINTQDNGMFQGFTLDGYCQLHW